MHSSGMCTSVEYWTSEALRLDLTPTACLVLTLIFCGTTKVLASQGSVVI